MEVQRRHHLRRLTLLLRESPVVALLGARQIGKSTLARQLVAARRGPTTWFDLENPRTEAPRLTTSMRSAVETLDLQRLDVVHAGQRLYRLAPRVRALPATQLPTALRPLRG